MDKRLLALSRNDPLYYNIQPCFGGALPVAAATPRTFGRNMKTFTIIDTIEVSDISFRHYSEWKLKYESPGLIAVLDPDEALDPPFTSGSWVTIHRPDNSSMRRFTTVAERPSTAFGLFFPHLTSDDVPRLSRVEYDETSQAEQGQ